jgi:protein gp37
MGKTSIEWVCAPGYKPETWNPVRGCSRVSEGCRNCYAERQAVRFPWGEPYARSTLAGPRWTGRVELVSHKLDEPLHWREPRMGFVNSMSDLFHEALPLEDIAAVYNVMAAADRHTFQVLTKRPSRRQEFFRWVVSEEAWPSLGRALQVSLEVAWPLPNVWEGVSVEDRRTADERIPLLLETPAALRFISYEPALEGIDCSDKFARYREVGKNLLPLPDWLIVGGESGPGARPFDVAWARSVIRQCREAGVPAFCKQLGARWAGAENAGRDRNLQKLRHPKGGDPSEWPEDLRVREWPDAARRHSAKRCGE